MHMQLALALLSFLYSYEESVLGQRDWSSLERVLWMKSTMRRSAKAIMRTRKGAIIYVAVAVKEKKKSNVMEPAKYARPAPVSFDRFWLS